VTDQVVCLILGTMGVLEEPPDWKVVFFMCQCANTQKADWLGALHSALCVVEFGTVFVE
jgi:hypothetical protein